MRRASTLAAVLAAAGGLLLADAASAQSDPRYLSWSGRGEATPPQGAPAVPTTVRRDIRRPNPVIPHGGAAARDAAPNRLTPAPGPARRTLTPANAWLQPAAPAPETAPASAAVMAPPSAAPTPAPPPPPPPPPRPGPEYLPDQGGRGQPAPAELIYPAPARTEDLGADAAADPMAPRRDALIFQMQSSTPPPDQAATPVAAPVQPPAETPAPTRQVMEVANSGEAPPTRSGGRYYSVHRQNGREPDPLAMPAPTYVDGLVVSGIETMASQDLAEPGQGPTLIRDRNGNMRAAPAPSDGDHQ
ncbi:MAG: hypothetical protein KL785_07420 [Brevundimonas sp.]|nr:hypothetical protein [Brevundimonas sp.]